MIRYDGDALVGEERGGGHAGPARADDHDVGLLDDRVAGEAGFDERVGVEVLVEVA